MNPRTRALFHILLGALLGLAVVYTQADFFDPIFDPAAAQGAHQH